MSVFFHYFTAFQSSFELTELGQFYRDYQRLIAAAPQLMEALEVALLAMMHSPIMLADIQFVKTALNTAKGVT